MALHSDSDLLSSILGRLRLRAEIFAHGDFCGLWRLDTSGAGRMSFHLVGRGSCWLHTRNQTAPVALNAGDLIAFPRDAWHEITPERDPQQATDAHTTVMCGYFDFGEHGHNALLDALPDLIHIPAEQATQQGMLELVSRLLLTEASDQALGRQLALDRMAEVLFVLMVRQVMARAEDERGLLAALADPRISRALSAIHAQPGSNWSVASMAARAGMSRTAFSLEFAARAGVPPMRYLSELRLRQADRMLRDSRNSVAMIAESVGYGDETAFRRAYQRFFGVGPGAVRAGRATGMNAKS